MQYFYKTNAWWTNISKDNSFDVNRKNLLNYIFRNTINLKRFILAFNLLALATTKTPTTKDGWNALPGSKSP